MTNDPYAGEPVIQPTQPVIPVVRATSVVAAPVRRSMAWRTFSPAAVLAVLLAIFLAVMGAVAVIRAGTEGPLDEPIVAVAGFDHTAILGFIEIGAGILLLAVGLSRDRGGLLFVSILVAVAALIAAIEPIEALAVERSFAVLIVIAAALIAALAALVPTMWRTTEHVEPI